MAESLLTTKFYIPPIRPELISRPRLIELLNAGLHRKLTLISAPAGFGKTTLVSEWVKKSDIPVVWLSLDKNDNDPTLFLIYFVSALNQIKEIEDAIGTKALNLLHSPQPPLIENILTLLINEIAALSNKILFVLDDYHLIESQQIHDALTFFLENLPPNIHMVITTREDPRLPTGGLRVKDQLTEIRAADLRFTFSEASQFFHQATGLNLSENNVKALESRTEGWVAGLQLAAISIRGQSEITEYIKTFTGSNRFVLDYLIEEVLEQQPENVQTFLLNTAILSRMTGSLCDALNEQDNGQETLEMLERSNLFIIPLDQKRQWYRYHHLFADLLRQRLHQRNPEKILVLHSRASLWYENNDFPFEMINHTLQAKEFDRAAVLIENNIDSIWQRGEHGKIREWLTLLPTDFITSKPHLCILQAWDLFTSGKLNSAEQSLKSAEEALKTSQEQIPEPEKKKILGRVAAIRAFIASYQGYLQETIHFANEALEYLPKIDPTWRVTAAIALGDAYNLSGGFEDAYRAYFEAVEVSKAGGNISMIANLKLANTYKQQGLLHKANIICQQQFELAQETGMAQTVVAGWLLAVWAEVLAEINDLDQAFNRANQGIILTKQGKDMMVIGWSYLCLVQVLFSKCEYKNAQQIIKDFLQISRKYDIPPFISNPMAAWQARIWLVQSKLEAVQQWVHERGLDIDGDIDALREMEYLVLARMLIAQKNFDSTTKLLQGMFESAKAGERIARVVEILNLQAINYQINNDDFNSMAALEQALQIAEPCGFIRLFVDEGPSMEVLLKKMKASNNKTKEYINKLLSAFEGKPPVSTFAAQSLVEPLSNRELEVLDLIAKGLTNQQIASRLFLSLHTIKAHTRNINQKLGTNNRTQATAKARELGLLSTG